MSKFVDPTTGNVINDPVSTVEGIYYLDELTGKVTFVSDPGFTGTAKGVTVSLTTSVGRDKDGLSLIHIYIKDAIENGFSLASLDINRIPYLDKISDGKIVLGLKTIKGLPRDFALWIIEERKQNGKYISIEDFLTRIPSKYQKEMCIRDSHNILLRDHKVKCYYFHPILA